MGSRSSAHWGPEVLDPCGWTGGLGKSAPSFGWHLTEGISEFDMKRKHCGLCVQDLQRLEEDLEGVGWSGSWVTPSVLGLCGAVAEVFLKPQHFGKPNLSQV